MHGSFEYYIYVANVMVLRINTDFPLPYRSISIKNISQCNRCEKYDLFFVPRSVTSTDKP